MVISQMFCWRYWKRSSFLLCVWNFVDFITLTVFHENWSIFWVSKTDVMFFSCWPNLYTFSFLFFFSSCSLIFYSFILPHFLITWGASPCFTLHLEKTTLVISYVEHLAFYLLDLLFSDFDIWIHFFFSPLPYVYIFSAFIQCSSWFHWECNSAILI